MRQEAIFDEIGALATAIFGEMNAAIVERGAGIDILIPSVGLALTAAIVEQSASAEDAVNWAERFGANLIAQVRAKVGSR